MVMIEEVFQLKNESLKWLRKKHPKLYKPIIILSILQLIMGLTALFFAYFSRETIDAALISTSSQTFILYATILGSLLFLQLITSTLLPYIRTRNTVNIENSLKKTLFERLLHKELKETSTYHTGDLLNHLTSDVHIVADGITDILPRLMFYLVRFLGAFILLFFIDNILALIIIAFGMLLLISSRLLAHPMKTRHKELQKTESSLRAMIQESLSHLSLIKSFESEDKMTSKLADLNRLYEKAALRKQRLSMLSSFGMTAFLALGYGLAIILGALRLSEGLISFGGLTALIQLVGHLQSPVGGMTSLVPKYYQSIASIERLKVLDDLKEDETSKEMIHSFDLLIAKDLSFAYQDEPIIHHLNFEIKPKDVVQITGVSGQGKTTLMKLLLGLYQPTHGSLHLIHKGISTPIHAGTRSLFSYVPQGSLMMSGTIKDNLNFYQTSLEETLWETLKIVGLDQDIKALPHRLDTKLGEKGLGLSEGQIQRLALARALLKDAPILLLDEITSALDASMENLILSNLKTMTNKTMIIISHRVLPSAYVNQTITL
jgi:ATP-binding cassette subfamily B protein